MERERTICASCGAQVEIVPAGISKKTGNAYGSFWKCKACGMSQDVGERPPVEKKPSEAMLKIDAMAKRLEDIYAMVEEIYNRPIN